MEIVVKDISNDTNVNHGFYCWHNHKVYTPVDGGYSKLKVSDSSGGCGMQQLYGWANVSDFATADALIKKALSTPNNGVGLFMCQVGQQYYNKAFVKALEANGFTASVEYNNIRHCSQGGYKQKLYMYHVPLKK